MKKIIASIVLGGAMIFGLSANASAETDVCENVPGTGWSYSETVNPSWTHHVEVKNGFCGRTLHAGNYGTITGYAHIEGQTPEECVEVTVSRNTNVELYVAFGENTGKENCDLNNDDNEDNDVEGTIVIASDN